MLGSTDSSILCIEPNELFFKILSRNVYKCNCKYTNEIKVLQAFVSNVSGGNYSMDTHTGTACKISGDNGVPSFTLIDICKYMGIPLSSINLIKVDTDGFDYECFCGIKNKLADISPVLYWENMFGKANKTNAYQGFSKLGEYLSAMGYVRFFIFDNYGNFLCDGDNKAYQTINDYLNRMDNLKTGKTFHYVDVVACKADKEELVRNKIDEYCKSFER